MKVLPASGVGFPPVSDVAVVANSICYTSFVVCSDVLIKNNHDVSTDDIVFPAYCKEAFFSCCC